ncbi:MAG TPA: SigE family RNA polymerase sigma factor [Mycobacteriales bacterium]|nr:SigE family RNA polymerase sigma factor [Mycobacteriales bacterium]
MSRDEDFAAFVAVSWPALVRTGRLLAPDAASAEDLVQSALLKTYARWRSVRDPGAYTRAVLTRLALRSGRRRWRAEVPTADLPEIAGPDEAAGIGSADEVRRLLAQLPRHQRAVIVLRFYCDFSEAEIAEVLRCSPGTVKSRTHRALAALRATAADSDLEVDR